MSDKRARILRLAEKVSAIREKATGTALTVPDPTTWSASDFDALVSDIYMWLYEEWGSEILYLARNAPLLGNEASAVRQFRSTLSDLRTSRQHSDVSKADRSAQRWMRETIGRSRPRDQDDLNNACAALVGECERALESLVGLAKSVDADAAARDLWRDMVVSEAALSEADMVAIVLGDLGVSLSAGTHEYLVRRAKGDWKYRRQSLTATDNVGQAIEHVVERLLVGHLIEALPSSYNDVVEAVGLEAGDRRVVGLLLLAHGAAALLDYSDGNEFLDLVEERFAPWFTAAP